NFEPSGVLLVRSIPAWCEGNRHCGRRTDNSYSDCLFGWTDNGAVRGWDRYAHYNTWRIFDALEQGQAYGHDSSKSHRQSDNGILWGLVRRNVHVYSDCRVRLL